MVSSMSGGRTDVKIESVMTDTVQVMLSRDHRSMSCFQPVPIKIPDMLFRFSYESGLFLAL
jgi:hypothetical protein